MSSGLDARLCFASPPLCQAVIQPLTELLRNMASPHGNSTERIVHYTLAALEARFKGKPLGPLFASMTLSSQVSTATLFQTVPGHARTPREFVWALEEVGVV